MGTLKLNTTSGGSLSIQAADGASDNTLTLPAVTGGNIVTTADSGTITQGMLDSSATNTPIFSAYMSSVTTGSDNTATKVQFDTENIDTDGAFDTSLYRFTVPSGKDGKYQVNASVRISSGANSNLATSFVYLYKNGSAVNISYHNFSTSYPRDIHHDLSVILDLSSGDYLEIYAAGNNVNNADFTVTSGSYSHFSAHKLIG